MSIDAIDHDSTVQRAASRIPVVAGVVPVATDGNVPAPSASWVPADACTLSGDDRARRLVEFERVFTTTLRSSERRAGTWLRLRLDRSGGLEEEVRTLIARETACCTFFEFDLRPSREELVLDIRVPPDRAEVLTGIEAQALSARKPGR